MTEALSARRHTILAISTLLLMATLLTGCIGGDNDVRLTEAELAEILGTTGSQSSDAPMDSLTVESLEIHARTNGGLLLELHDDKWHGSLPAIQTGESLELTVHLIDDIGAIPLISDGPYKVAVRVLSGDVSVEIHGDQVALHGESAGEAEIVFRLLENGERVWESPSILVTVLAEDTLEIRSFTLLTRNPTKAHAYIHGDHWHGNLPSIKQGSSLRLEADASDPTGTIALGNNHPYQLTARTLHGPANVVSHGDHVRIHATGSGNGELVFRIMQGAQIAWESPAIAFQVGSAPQTTHSTVAGFSLHDRADGGKQLAYIHGNHWHGELPTIKVGEDLHLEGIFIDDNNIALPVGHDKTFQIVARHATGGGIVSLSSHGDHVRLHGSTAGTASIYFQLWHNDHSDWESPKIEVHVVNSESQNHDHDHNHDVVESLVIKNRDNEPKYLELHGDHWHGSLPSLEVGEELELDFVFKDSDGHTIPLGGDSDNQVKARLADDATPGIISIANHTDHIDIDALAEGTTSIVFELWHDDHVEWTSPSATITVEHHDHDHHSDGDVDGLELIDRSTGDVTAYIHGDHWHGALPVIEEGDRISIGAVFYDHDGHEIPIGSDEKYQLNARLVEGQPEIVTFNSHGDHIHIHGDEEGETQIIFQLWHDDHADWESPPISVTIVDDHDHDHDHDHEEFEVTVYNRETGEELMEFHDDHWDGSLPTLEVGKELELDFVFKDHDGIEIDLDGDYQVKARLADDATPGIISIANHTDHIDIDALAEGTTSIVFELWHDDHVEWSSPPAEITVAGPSPE